MTLREPSILAVLEKFGEKLTSVKSITIEDEISKNTYPKQLLNHLPPVRLDSLKYNEVYQTSKQQKYQQLIQNSPIHRSSIDFFGEQAFTVQPPQTAKHQGNKHIDFYHSPCQ